MLSQRYSNFKKISCDRVVMNPMLKSIVCGSVKLDFE